MNALFSRNNSKRISKGLVYTRYSYTVKHANAIYTEGEAWSVICIVTQQNDATLSFGACWLELFIG